MNVFITQIIVFAAFLFIQWAYYQIRDYLDSRKMWLEFERKVKNERAKHEAVERETMLRFFKEVEKNIPASRKK